ncbi:Ig-like domain-containing protein [Streptomyces smaragdinus]|nr:Ig-like domain-containing protein [Streptomyces smaragdinus]
MIDNAPLDVTALSALTVPLPTTVAVGDLLTLGTVTQYAEADPNGASTANTSTTNLSADLIPLIGATPALSTANLSFGAIGSEATLASDGTLTRTTHIADATLTMTSPLIGDMVTQVNSAVSTLTTALNGLQSTITSAVNSSVTQIINLVGGITGTANTNTTVSVDASRLDQAVADVLSAPLSTSLVTIDPSTGTITVNLAGGIDLNNIPPNTTLLSPEIMQQVSADIATLMNQLQSNLDAVINDALNYVDVTVHSTTAITAPFIGQIAGLTIDYTGTVKDLINGTAPIAIDGTGLLAPVPLDAAATIIQNTVAAAVNSAAGAPIATAGAAVDAAVTTASNALAPAMALVGQAAQVNLNVQNAADGITAQADVTAVQLVLLPGTNAFTMNLATSSVGPNVNVVYTPTVAASNTNPGTPTTITGGGWPPNTDVTLQVTDSTGAPVGSPITVTTDATGSLPPGTEYPIPAGTPLGTYTVTGTTAGGTTASGTFQVVDTIAPDAPVITAPADGSVTTDNTPVITGTGEPGATVEVLVDGVTVGTATVAPDGTWSLPTTTPLPDGPHTVTATQTDPSGNVSPAATSTFTVDTTAPDAPVITGPADGSTITSTTPTITGTGEPGATVDVTVDGVSLGSTTVNPDGTWSLPVTTPLADGPHTVSAIQTDPAGNVSPAATSTFTIDTTAPAAPVIEAPTSGTTTADTTPTVSGTGTPGSTVTVTDGTGAVLGTALVGLDGSWSFDSVPLADGTYTITATQTDPVGNVSPLSNSVIFTVDTTAPAAPVITGPADGSIIGTNTPTITGTGEPGATVNVVVDGTPLGTATVAPDGTWSLPVTTPLADGPHTVDATQTDASGNISPAATSTFTVDTTAPAAPVISTPADGSTISDTTPTISGTGEPGATVNVVLDGTPIGTATVGLDGTWSLPTPAPLADGVHTVDATQTDALGNVSPAATNTFTVDATAPAAPVITAPADGSTTGNNTPTITGTGEPGDTVNVVVDGVPLGTATVAPDGTWSIPVTTPLADGPHTIEATQTDPAGNISPAATSTFTVDTTAPDAPVITGPADGSTITSTTPTITGTGEPGATVDVTIDGTVVGTTVVAPDGTWSLPTTTPLADGPHTVTATQTDPSGNVSPVATSTFTVDTTAPDAPVITSPAEGSVTSDTTPTITGTGTPGSTVTVTDTSGITLGTATVAPDGTWSFDSVPLADSTYTISATQTDPAGNVSPVSNSVIFTVDTAAPSAPTITSPADGSTIADNTPTITGTGEPGATVDVVVDGVPVGTATVGLDGTWSLPTTTPLADGPHTVTATQTDASGNVSPAATSNFTVDATAPAAPVITAPADGSTTGNPTPTITGTGEPGATVDVVVDGVPLGTATVAPDGTWSIPVTTPLADGPHTVTATQTDPSGNVSPAATSNFTVDTTAPGAPTITGPADGSTISTTTPTITGTGEPGATVEVTVDGTVIGQTTVNPDGTWSLPTTTPLADGPHTVSAIQTDTSGNISPPATSTFTVDTTAPDAPVITAPTSGTSTSDTTPTISGTGTPGSTVTVTDGTGAVLGTAPVAPDGTWSFDSVPLPDGTYTITATQTDAVGNVSPLSNSVIFTVDTAAPAAPVITGPADGSTINNSTPTITGTGEPGATVDVVVDGVPLGTATVAPDGTWSIPVTTPLADGPHTVTATQTDAAGNVSPVATSNFTIDATAPAAPVITAPADGSTITSATPTITGSGEPGATVEVTLDGAVLGTVTVAPDGTWSLPVTTPLADGPHTVTATQTDPLGNVSPVATSNFTVDTTADAAPVITSPTQGQVTADTTPDITGTGVPGATVDVTLDGTVIGTTTVAPDGTWTLPVTTPLADGTHTVSATQTDPSGNVSPASTPVDFTVDTTAPAAPVIAFPGQGDVTSDTTPIVTGTGEPGATVTVSIDGVVIGTTTVNPDSTWSLQTTDPLADGPHTVSATQTDVVGNVSPAASNDFTVDSTGPAAPVITSPAAGSTTADSTPDITGTGEPGATVEVFVDGTAIGVTTVAPDGTWTFTPTTPLADGPHTVTATQTDAAGIVSPVSAPVDFTVDTGAPAAPVITAPADGSTISSPTPTITGTGEPGATVNVVLDGTPLGTATVAPDGTWSLPVTTPLADGPHTVEATQTDATGNVSPAATSTFTVDATAPAAPVITGPADGSTITSTTPTITGTGEPGATVDVTVDGTVVGQTTVNPDGTWSLPVTTPLADGPHTVTATQTDPSGNVSPAATSTFTVDTTAPAAPVIEAPTSGSSTTDTTPTVSGTGTPDSVVTVTDSTGAVLGTATVAPDGTWSFDSVALADGTYTISATQTDPSGNVSPVSNSVIFTVDTTAPAAPVITGPADGSTINDPTPTITGTGEPGATVEVTVDGTVIGTTTVNPDGTWSLPTTTPLADGPHTVSATQTDAAGNTSPAGTSTFTVDATAPAAPVITAPADGSTIGDPTPTISGTGEPGATVNVVLDGTPLGTVTVAPDGTWSLPVTTPLADGPHTVEATQTDALGNVSPAATSTFTVDATAPAAPVITGPADGSTITSTTPTITGTGEPGATVDVTVDGTPVGTATVNPDGTWSLPVTTPLADGSHTISATQTDPAGNVSPAATSTFTVDTTAPAAPVITAPTSGTTTTDNTPTVSGTGTPGSTVTVTDGTGAVLGTALVAPDGTWSFDTAVLADGTYTISATQTDASGNVSPVSNSVIFTVDTTAPAAPVITSPAAGSTITDNTPTITGTGEPGATVEVSVDGTVIGTTTVNPDGTWSLPTTTPLADGPHTVSATQTDAAGNVSPAGSNDFTVNTTVTVEPPVITSPSSGDVIGDSTPTITGTGTPGDTVTVIVDGTPAGTTTVQPDGTWTFTPSTPLGEGDHTVTATQTDPAGNVSPPSAPVDITIDTVAPAAPVITSPADGSTITDNTPTVTGTGEPGATVEVSVDGTVIGTTTVNPDGTWTFDLTTPLADGPHTVSATQTDAAGNTSPAGSNDFTVNTTVTVPAPVITSPADGSTVTDATPTITGTGVPGDTVEVSVDGTVIGTVTVGLDGSWSIDVPTALADGAHTVSATQTDAAGNVSPAASNDFTVNTTVTVEPPVITSPSSGDVIGDSTPTITGTGTPGDTVTVIVDGTPAGTTTVQPDGTWTFTPSTPLGEGDHTITATQTDAAGNTSDPSAPVDITIDTVAPAAPVITSPADGSTITDSTPTVTGTGEPGATVEVSVDGTVVGTTTVNPDGTWSLDVTTPLADGPHTVSATQTDAAGNVSPAGSNDFTVNTTVTVEPPVITSPSSGDVIGDSTPTISGTGTPGDTIEVIVDGTPIGTTTVDPDGTWTFTPSTPLGDGDHTITATETDAAGNTSDPSAPVDITIDTVAPDAPVITGPADGSTVNDSTPTITGTGEPGATVEVSVDGTVVGTTTVRPDGTWSLELTDPLADGPHTVSATQTDAAGNTSPAGSNDFTVDTTVTVEPPVITSPTDGEVVHDNTPTITGTGEPGDTVQVIVDGRQVGTTTVGSDGTWTFTPSDTLGEGEHTVTATETDAEGNVSEPSAPVDFIVDVVPPREVGTITVHKTDESTGDPLAGAVFQLWQESNGTAGLQTDGADPDTAIDTACATDGEGICTFAALTLDTYYLEETDVPEGFQLPDNPITGPLELVRDNQVITEELTNVPAQVCKKGKACK